MATNPETVVPSAPPPQGDAARHAQGRVAIREYLRQNKGKATLEGVTDLAATFGLTFSKENEPFVKLAVEWANREDTDVDLLQITTDPLAPATGDVAQTEITTPEAPTPEPVPTPLEAFYTGAADVFARPSLFDPETRQYVESLGPLGRRLYAPVLDIGADALTTVQAGFEGAGLAAGQLMENVGLLNLIEQATGVKQTPEYAQRQFLGVLESEGLRAPMGYVPPGYAVATGQVPVSASRMAQALERAEPLPLTAPPPTPMARIAQAPEPLPTRAPRAAAAAPRPAPAAAVPETPAPTVAAAADVPPVSATQRAEDAFSLDVLTPTEEKQLILAPAKQKEIMAYQTDYAKLLAERGINKPKGRTQSEWIQSHMQAETIPVEDLLPIMQRHNVNSLEDQLRAAGISRESLSRSGRDLNQASQLRRLLLRAAQENPALAEQLGVGADAIKEASSVHRRLMGIESALLTTQMKTIVRNLVGATPQMPAYTMVEELTDAAIREARNIGRAPEEKLLGPSLADPLYAFWDTVGGSIVDAARAGADASLSRATRGRMNVSRSARALRNERTIKELRDAFPNEYSKLFGRYASDQVSMGPSNTRVGRVLSGAERALDVAHIGTRTMDRWVKNTQFPILLDMELRRVGRSLDEVFDTGDFASIPEPILESAIRRMHKRVFEDRPEGPEWYNRASRSFIDLLNYSLRPAGMAPFPNFMVSFGKYVFEQNPAAIVRFASKAEQKKIADGDARAIGKIAAGLAGTLAWLTYKNFDDGTDWFEFYSPEGEVIDVSAAAAPSLPSLWQAYLIHKYTTNRMNEVKWSKDIAKVVGASNMRAGFNGYMVDSGFADIVDAAQRGESGAQIKKMFGEYMAQRVGGLTLLLRNFRDTVAETGLQDTTLRTPETVGQSVMSNLPFGVETYTAVTGTEIPARFAPTRAGELQERDPLLGQLTGGFFRGERNPLEQQLIRLGVAPGSLSRASGISDTYDRLLTAEIGDIAEKQLLPFLDERAPLGETPEKQRLLLRDEYTKIRSAARGRVLRNYPIYRFATEYENLSRDEKRLADKKNMADPQRGRSVPEFVSEVESIDPAMPVVRKSGPARELDLAAVPSGAAYADGRTFTIRVKP